MVTVLQLKNKLRNMKQQFRTYREAVGKTGNPHIKPLPHFDSLYAIYGERPLDKPRTVACGLAAEGRQEVPLQDSVEDAQDEVDTMEQEAQEVNIPEPAEVRKKPKRLRALSHSERMEQLHGKILQELKDQGERELRNQETLIEIQKEALQAFKEAQ